MALVRRSTAVVTGCALAVALTACTGETPADDATPPASAAPSPPGSPTPGVPPTPTATEPDDAPTTDETQDPVPPGFADPESLVGQELTSELGPDGSPDTVVGGVPLEPAYLFGSCFAGGTGDVCAYSIEAAAPLGPDGNPAESDAALLLLLRSTGPGDRPTWLVLDAVITRPPAPPALLQVCEGEPGVAFYPAAGEEPGAGTGTLRAAAAWGPDDDVSELVELDPSSVVCQAVGH